MPRRPIARSYGKSMCSLVRNCQTVLKVAMPLYMSPAIVCISPCCSTSFPAFGGVSVPDFCHLNRCEVETYCYSNLHVPDDIWYGAYFHMLFCHLYVFFGEVSGKVFGLFFKSNCFLICWVLRLLCILWITILYQFCLMQLFSSSLELVFSFSWHCLSQNSFKF